MPTLQGAVAVGSGSTRGMNAFTLKELLRRRIPGYDDTEYLSEINDCYEEAWQEIQQLDEMFFADLTTLTVTAQTDTFDIIFNIYGSLSSGIPRLHQIHRIRVQQPNDNGMQPVSWTDPNSPEYLGRSVVQGQPPRTTPSYLVVPFGEGSMKFAEPMQVGTLIEVWYTYKQLDLQVLNTGSITNNGTNIIGTNTGFTQLVPSNLQQYLPGFGGSLLENQVNAEIIVQGRTFRVVRVVSDNLLIIDQVPQNLPAQTTYILASVPEFPAGGHRYIATLATRNFFSTPHEDARFEAWNNKAMLAKESLKNTFMQRQRQEPPKKKRFPYGTTRRARFFGVK